MELVLNVGTHQRAWSCVSAKCGESEIGNRAELAKRLLKASKNSLNVRDIQPHQVQR